ncbi:MAG: tRNA 2-thiouridine(34) synthase MnmA [Nitrospiraceae bacterium]|nr:tRNA 2-thiouridine(34) synthase MnmA [Nitrospiraceae bacterium]
MRAKGKVVVGLSGGIDSAVAATLLVRQGFEVVGVTLQVWEAEDEAREATKKWQERSCCKVGLARFATEQLGIAHHVVDVKSEFRKAVIDDFIDGYAAGQTPNPCVRCNERVKFAQLYEVAQSLQADYVATGHYVQLVRDMATDEIHLTRAVDRSKDQTYFLHRLQRDWLPHLLFPLGALKKSDVWTIAESLGLPVDEISESQEICFVTQSSYREFLEKEVPEIGRPGNIVDLSGLVLGQHQGVFNYTSGQRRGLGVATGERMFVLEVEPQTDTVVVGPEEKLFRSDCLVGDLNLLCSTKTLFEKPVMGKIRYATTVAPAVVKPHSDNVVQVVFETAQRAITPGQSAVFYRGDQVLGGGIIINSKGGRS